MGVMDIFARLRNFLKKDPVHEEKEVEFEGGVDGLIGDKSSLDFPSREKVAELGGFSELELAADLILRA